MRPKAGLFRCSARRLTVALSRKGLRLRGVAGGVDDLGSRVTALAARGGDTPTDRRLSCAARVRRLRVRVGRRRCGCGMGRLRMGHARGDLRRSAMASAITKVMRRVGRRRKASPSAKRSGPFVDVLSAKGCEVGKGVDRRGVKSLAPNARIAVHSEIGRSRV